MDLKYRSLRLKLGIFVKAHYKVEKILSRSDLFKIDRDRAKEIDDVIKRAEKLL